MSAESDQQLGGRGSGCDADPDCDQAHDSPSHIPISRRSVLVGAGAGTFTMPAWASSIVAGQSGVRVEVDGEIESGTQLVVRVRDSRGRNQEFEVDGSMQLPASTTLSRIRTRGEAELDLLVYGSGTIELDRLEITPISDPYPEESASPDPTYAIARNITTTVTSVLTYVAIFATMLGTGVFAKRWASSASGMSRAKRWISGGVLLLVLLSGMRVVYSVLIGLVP